MLKVIQDAIKLTQDALPFGSGAKPTDCQRTNSQAMIRSQLVLNLAEFLVLNMPGVLELPVYQQFLINTIFRKVLATAYEAGDCCEQTAITALKLFENPAVKSITFVGMSDQKGKRLNQNLLYATTNESNKLWVIDTWQSFVKQCKPNQLTATLNDVAKQAQLNPKSTKMTKDVVTTEQFKASLPLLIEYLNRLLKGNVLTEAIFKAELIKAYRYTEKFVRAMGAQKDFTEADIQPHLALLMARALDKTAQAGIEFTEGFKLTPQLDNIKRNTIRLLLALQGLQKPIAADAKASATPAAGSAAAAAGSGSGATDKDRAAKLVSAVRAVKEGEKAPAKVLGDAKAAAVVKADDAVKGQKDIGKAGAVGAAPAPTPPGVAAAIVANSSIIQKPIGAQGPGAQQADESQGATTLRLQNTS